VDRLQSGPGTPPADPRPSNPRDQSSLKIIKLLNCFLADVLKS
jgi:hypothetical protein